MNISVTCNVLNGTSTHDREQLFQIILKSIHNCRSYGPDKFRLADALEHAHTPNCYCNNYISLTASGLNNSKVKNDTEKSF